MTTKINAARKTAVIVSEHRAINAIEGGRRDRCARNPQAVKAALQRVRAEGRRAYAEIDGLRIGDDQIPWIE